MALDALEVHPAAEAWPTMSEAEIEQLAEDIKANGLRHPVVLFEGQLLDGRNRVKAAKLVGVEVKTVELPVGQNPFLYVASANGRRLHLGAGDRARYLVDVLQKAGELDRMRAEAKKRKKSGKSTLVSNDTKVPEGQVRDQIAKATGASPATVARVLAEASEAAAAADAHQTEGEPARSRPAKDRRKTAYKRGASAHWHVPRHPKKLAAFLKERWTSTELRDFMAAMKRS